MKSSLNSTTKIGKVLHLIILFAIKNVQIRFYGYFFKLPVLPFSA